MRTARTVRSTPPHAQPLKGEQPMNTNTATEYRNLPLAVLTESATNPRRIFEDFALKELAESIRSQGVLSLLACAASHGSELRDCRRSQTLSRCPDCGSP